MLQVKKGNIERARENLLANPILVDQLKELIMFPFPQPFWLKQKNSLAWDSFCQTSQITEAMRDRLKKRAKLQRTPRIVFNDLNQVGYSLIKTVFSKQNANKLKNCNQ